MPKNRLWLFATLLWLIVIFLFTQLPYFNGAHTEAVINKTVTSVNETAPTTKEAAGFSINFIVRKSAHFTVFGILAFFIWNCVKKYRFSYILAWILTFIYAMSDEWHQSFIPGREASFRDVLIDSFGALIVLSLVFIINNRRKRSVKTY
ncbi:VanZ family protein [Priestia abyssalis]|uniref:VanZ family protein n=1 Tax=Priestia abyssalis TaxID=1221450 RepID=UPI000994B187|nr:VanZ family protein [Priestia abyssalis]